MVPFLDLKAQYRVIADEIRQAVDRVLESGRFTLGPEVEAFEQEFAAYCGTKHAVGVNSGTSALHLALLAAGVAPGHEVITVPMTFVATVAAIGYAGAIPVFVDVDPQFYTMDPEKIESAITERTKAIVPVHLYGQPAEMDRIIEIAAKHKIAVIEDAAQAHGAEYRGKRVGALGELGAFSFYPGKNLGAYGEGGMVVTNDDKHARTVRMLRDWGTETKYYHELKGFNYRMDAIQGAILRVKLRHLEDWIRSRRILAVRYEERLAATSLVLPAAMPDARHVYHLYAVRSHHRESLQTALAENNIYTGLHYPVPVHLQKAWSELPYKKGDFPVSERIANEEISLPMFPEMSQEQLEDVCDALCVWASGEE
ncbi:MAG: DegT/DnrJ/EryC1/StrS family aminotransferase [Desulfomonile tiedjei]|uniref:DegT/DnrJ/EryC1/StrS family aminotransferase n=1 Tax=Desulfomonile tiedjei TaxID=2358 RepID=A0A9D6V2H1_9BACT|nr:DegT/DnrJ/EryC1/StrS family aminotransferase [Desulfomonile tiedjei]